MSEHSTAAALDPTPSKSASKENSARLEAVLKRGKYTNIRFWVPPNVLPSQDECISELADALEAIEKEEAKSDIKFADDETI